MLLPKTSISICLVVLLAGALLVTRPAAAQKVASVSSATIFEDRAMTLDQAVAMVEAKYKAKALRYNTTDENGQQVHYIRLITADRSRVFTVSIDAATGRELPARE